MTGRTRKPRRDGQESRAAILRAARELFVEYGYERTTVRAIAERAGRNPALVTRYFGGKAGLFANIVFGSALEDVNPLLPDVPFRSWGHALVRRHVRLTGRNSRDELHDQLVMLLRSTATADGARMLGDVLARMDIQQIAEHATDPDAELRTALIHAQLLGLTMLRDIVGLAPLRNADADTIARYLGPAVQRLVRPVTPDRH